eukprot:4480760-Amphidinium_carterae.1
MLRASNGQMYFCMTGSLLYTAVKVTACSACRFAKTHVYQIVANGLEMWLSNRVNVIIGEAIMNK